MTTAITWQLRLYVSGQAPAGTRALKNLQSICAAHLGVDGYDIQVVDIRADPGSAADDQILAVPTLVRKAPLPRRKIIGDLSNEEDVVAGLDL